MNMQAMIKQAQKMQADITKKKEEINKKEFTGESSFLKVLVNGKKEIISVNINADSFDKEDIEMLQDMITIAINNAFKLVDKEIDDKLGSIAPGMSSFM